MRFGVDMSLEKPSRSGICIVIKFKYEKLLMDLRYACGKLGHDYQQSFKYDDLTPISELPYGMWLRRTRIQGEGGLLTS